METFVLHFLCRKALYRMCALLDRYSCYNLSAHSFLHTSNLKDTLTEYLYSNVRKVYFRKTTPHNPTPQWTGTHTRSTHTYRDFKGNRNYSLHTNWGLAYSPWLSPWLSFIWNKYTHKYKTGKYKTSETHVLFCCFCFLQPKDIVFPFISKGYGLFLFYFILFQVISWCDSSKRNLWQKTFQTFHCYTLMFLSINARIPTCVELSWHLFPLCFTAWD